MDSRHLTEIREPGYARSITTRAASRFLAGGVRRAGRASPSSGAPDRWGLLLLSRMLDGAPVRLTLWDGTAVTPGRKAVATIRIRDRRTLFALIFRAELGLGEAYTDGRLVVDGDLTEVIEAVFRQRTGRWLSSRLLRRPAGASRRAARDNVHAHYDLGNAFYQLWLDDAMVYTCAYYERPDATLETAQIAKLDHVCRKLQLRPGEHVIEAGSGWGALALHMAQHYGVTVESYNISTEQLEYSRTRARRLGLDGRVEFIEGDYRTIGGRCDAFASVGMLEHVGPGRYQALGEVIDRVLDPDHGRGLLHFIGRNHRARFSPWVERYVFPGAHAPALSEVMPRVFEPFDLAVEDVENLRLHYAATLAEWLARFEANADRVREMFDDRFVRMWRLYLASSKASFACGKLQLFQILFRRPKLGGAPPTRRALYGRPPA